MLVSIMRKLKKASNQHRLPAIGDQANKMFAFQKGIHDSIRRVRFANYSQPTRASNLYALTSNPAAIFR